MLHHEALLMCSASYFTLHVKGVSTDTVFPVLSRATLSNCVRR